MRQRRAFSWLLARAKTCRGVATELRTRGVDAILVGCEADDLTKEERDFVEAVARNPLHRFTTWLDWQFYRINRLFGFVPSPRTDEPKAVEEAEPQDNGNPWW